MYPIPALNPFGAAPRFKVNVDCKGSMVADSEGLGVAVPEGLGVAVRVASVGVLTVPVLLVVLVAVSKDVVLVERAKVEERRVLV